jgi:hypothetical protein
MMQFHAALGAGGRVIFLCVLPACMSPVYDAESQFYRYAGFERTRTASCSTISLTGVDNPARCLQALGDASATLPLFRRAAEGSERELRPDHPINTRTKTALADDSRFRCIDTLHTGQTASACVY